MSLRVRPFLPLLVLATAVSAAGAGAPNLVLILADDLGYGEVSFHGQQRYTTPNIDRIAREGLTFPQKPN